MADEFPVLEPSLQISFFHRLQDLNETFLAVALLQAVKSASLEELDKQLSQYVKPS